MKKFASNTLMAICLLGLTPNVSLAADAVPGSELVDIADASIGLNGLVCDFCSIALNKTFKKNAAVSGTYVDLDTKTMSVVFKDGQSIADEALVKMVEKAGYNVTKITRKDGTQYVPPAKAKKSKKKKS